MDSPSFKCFHAQLDYKLTYIDKYQTQLALVYYTKFRVQKQNRKTQELLKI